MEAARRIQEDDDLSSIKPELDALYRKHRGLDPRIVVEWARRHPGSALHDRFEWNDTRAAEEYRLWQAREIITEVLVEYPDGKVRQAYVSLVAMRGRGKPGYLSMVDVLGDRKLRKQLLLQALNEYERVGEKYHDLAALAGVRAAVRRARARA